MARKPNPPAVVLEPAINHKAFAQSHADLNTLSVMNADTLEKAGDVATAFGYIGALTVGALEDKIRFYQHRTVEDCLELGKHLLILKELTPHGEFSQRIELLGIHERMARRFMGATLKFSKSDKKSVLSVVGNQSKLLELVVLDDGELDALENGETVRGVTLDDVDCMSASELRKAFREKQANEAATDRVLADLQDANTKLKKKLAGRQIDAHEEWSGAMKELVLHVAGHRAQILESVTALDVIREKVMQQEAEPGGEAALAAAREQIGRELAEAVERVEELVSKVRRLFDCTLGALIG